MRPVLAFLLLFLPAAAQVPASDQGLLHLASTPNARLHPVPVRAVSLQPGFWKSRQDTAIRNSIPTLLALLEEKGTLDNFRRLAKPNSGIPRRGPLYTDSDLYKWLEAAAWSLAVQPNPKLEATIDQTIDTILAAQEPSGYLNTWFTGDRSSLRWTQQTSGHELYCLGHMTQAAIAYYRVTGKRKLLDGSTKFIDYLVRDFGPSPKQPLLTGHPELELARAELYRTTGNRQYLDLAAYLLSGVERERLKLSNRDLVYLFSGKPFTGRTQFEGHAVRALYAATGAADYYLETGDPAYRRTLETLAADLSSSKMFVTGGVGSRASGEAFGEPFELPNRQAYTESCAAIAGMLFHQRMLAATGDARYADLIERALYNGINSGMSSSGTLYCYRNPLAASASDRIRNPWYDTCCCPPNLQRTFAALGAYFYSTSRDGLWVHLYDNSTLDWRLESGTALKAQVQTGQPWRGDVQVTLTPAKIEEFTLYFRIPSWSLKTTVLINGNPAAEQPKPNTYLALKRAWKPGDKVTLTLDVETRLVYANPRVSEDYGKAAIQRGPILYAAEQTDNPGPAVFDLAIDHRNPISAEFLPSLLGGVTVLTHKGLALDSSTGLYAYQPPSASKPAAMTLIPYYAFHDRGPANFTVWLPVR
ncbi:MAG: glycoside hydrolase family 127 protein [Acidobacteria bacterium]|nr:glycoside hydrolase family 127 protein [Acidobacteriota bacterium]